MKLNCDVAVLLHGGGFKYAHTHTLTCARVYGRARVPALTPARMYTLHTHTRMRTHTRTHTSASAHTLHTHTHFVYGTHMQHSITRAAAKNYVTVTTHTHTHLCELDEEQGLCRGVLCDDDCRGREKKV